MFACWLVFVFGLYLILVNDLVVVGQLCFETALIQ